jgi:predicted Zn-dependent protease
MTRSLPKTALAWSLIALVACAVNPATGKRELSFVSESQEIQLGKQGAEDVARTIGVYPDPALNAYLSDLGMRIARSSERPDIPWQFHVADEPVVNAFALPGGPVFIARGILAYFNSEAELVSVLGHEIGHVTARHSAQAITRSQIAGVGVGLAQVGASMIDPRLNDYVGAASQGLGLLFLKYGRDAESQADALGFRYGVSNGWDMRDGTKMFNTLSRVSGDPGQRLPEWQSTHPAPEGRAQRNDERVKAAEARGVKFDTLRLDRNGYLRRLEGLIYGDDPRQGYFEGTKFYHPVLKLTFAFPEGWRTQNSPEAVAGVSEGQDAIIILSAAGKGSPQATGQKFAAQQGVTAGQGQSVTINGLTAYTLPFQAQSEQGNLGGRVTWISLDGTTFQVLGYGSAEKMQGNDPLFVAAGRSFARLTDPAKLNMQPKRVRIVTLRTSQTIVEVGRANGNVLPDAELASMNGVREDEVLPAGTLVKIVK